MESKPSNPPVVRPGDRVQVELVTSEGVEALEFVIVPDEGADFRRGLLGISAPLAQTLLGQPAGASLAYAQGDARAVRILAIAPATEALPVDEVARRREETLRKALEQANRTDAMIFASSFSGKWGDYDPKGIENWDEPEVGEPDSEKRQNADDAD